MSMDYIRQFYGVPAKRGSRIHFDHNGMNGKIVGSKGPYLLVKFSGWKRTFKLHPTWKITYLENT